MADEFDNDSEIEFATFEAAVDGDDEAAAVQAAQAEFGEFGDELVIDAEPDIAVPVVAIVGRPNVGKSTLVNRILGRREAVVEDIPGVTRDRVRYEAEWSGRRFTIIDTGGWDLRSKGLSSQVSEQAQRAAIDADMVVLVVDTTVGATDADAEAVEMLRRAKVPVLLVANKVDSAALEAEAASLWSLGVGEPFTVSALHGRGSGDLLDEIIKRLPEVGSGKLRDSGPRRVALLGRPNVGKSSLLNRLAGEERSVVDSVAGTTVDPVDELVEIAGTTWRFVDTAGIRRRVKGASGPEWYASLRTQSALERSEVCMVLIDASEELSEQDVRIIAKVIESGRGLVLALNKWDLVDEDRRYMLDREYDRDLAHVAWAPRVNISAKTGRHIDKIGVALDAALEGWETRVSTGRLNQFLKEVVASHPHPVRGGKQPRILFATQASIAPPTFVLFTSGFLEASYRRFIERRLREEFGFEGSPVRVDMRIRAKRKRR
jgi:GTP-binding protein